MAPYPKYPVFKNSTIWNKCCNTHESLKIAKNANWFVIIIGFFHIFLGVQKHGIQWVNLKQGKSIFQL